MVEHNGAVGKRLGCDKKTLAKRELGVWCEEFGKLGLDAVGPDNYVTSGEGEDGLVGKDGEAGFAGRVRGVELSECNVENI